MKNKNINKLKNIFNRKKSKDKDKDRKLTFNFYEVFIIMFSSILLGLLFGWIIFSSNFVFGSDYNYSNQIIKAYKNIVNNYVDSIDKEKLVNSAIEGMINSLEDPFSSYMDNSGTDTFKQSLQGEYVGLGITIAFKDNKCIIVDVLNNSPSKKKGIKADDIITEINGKNIENESFDYVINLLGNKKESNVSLKILRNDKELNFDLMKETIIIESVFSEVLKNNIGYIKIDTFAANTSKQFSDNLNKLMKKNIDSLIIDVRNNSGGMLNQVNNILDVFLDKKDILYIVKDKTKTKKIYAKKSSKFDLPIVVLMNEGSASASEILASSLSINYDDCILIGTATYGKGTIQRTSSLLGGSSVKFTVEKWLDAKGNYHGESGISPDIYINNVDESSEDYVDNQLNKAVEELNKKMKNKK